MDAPTALFFGLQLACPLLGMLAAYAHAYQRRVQGVSGHDLEADLARLGFLVTAGLSFFFFWGWPEGSRPWYRMPGFSFLAQVSLSPNPQNDPNYLILKLLCAAATAALMGLLARINAFALNRTLVRQVPRYFRDPKAVGKR